MLDDIEDVILAEGNFEYLSIHNRMYLFIPQELSNRPAKLRSSSALSSDNGESSLV